jgi:hypothetical protein
VVPEPHADWLPISIVKGAKPASIKYCGYCQKITDAWSSREMIPFTNGGVTAVP